RSNRRHIQNIVEPEFRAIKNIVLVADRTMEELLQAPTEGVQANKFHGFERDNPHTHISNFKRMTATLKYRDVPNNAIKLMLFPYSLEGAARVWACPHQGFSELTEIDTLYNGLTEQDQDSLNAAAGVNIVDVIDIACEEFVKDVLDFQYNPKSSSLTLVYDDLISESNSNPEGDILFLEKLLNEDPFQLPLMDLKLANESKEKSSVEEPPELELKELSSHLKYVFLEDSNKLPVINAKNLKIDEKEAPINVLKSYKWAIAWKIFDIKGIDPRFCTHKILMEDDYKPTIQSQRRRCMMFILHDMIEKTMEVFMDDFLVFGDSFSSCLTNLDKMLNRCEETNLVLNGRSVILCVEKALS
nr:reverse transcriptase domain-containing protein [Tanacetum cinerariifolium]